MKRWVLPTLLIAVLIGAWQIAASTGAIADALNLDPILVPSPAEIAESLWQNRALLLEDAWVTLREMLFGLGFAVLFGLAFAVAMHLSETLRIAFYPLIVTSQTIPVIAIAPILVVWFGFGIGPKLWVIALICFFPITVNTLAGLRSVDPEAKKMKRTLDASRGQILWRVEAPASLPQLFSGVRIAVAIAAIAAVFAEWVGADSGLGHLILISQSQLQTARVFATVVVLSGIAIALFWSVALAERRLAWWGREGRG